MPNTERGQYLIADAWSLHADALEMLAQGRIRNAAEKAWGATKRATDALILERTGREPKRTSQTSGGLKALSRQNAEFRELRARYIDRVAKLHANCFYNGICEPANIITGLILDTAGYISDAVFCKICWVVYHREAPP